MGREDEVKLIAYSIWQEEGCLDGRDWEHWFGAEAIWEQQQGKKAVPKSSGTESKQSVRQNAKVVAERKKSQRT